MNILLNFWLHHCFTSALNSNASKQYPIIARTMALNNSVVSQVIDAIDFYPFRILEDVEDFRFEIIPDQVLDEINEIVQSFSVRPIVLCEDGSWIRHYQHSEAEDAYMTELAPHTDDRYDEFSVVVQFHKGAFFFIFDESVENKPSLKNVTEEHLVHLEPGEMVIYRGYKHYHGCRRLEEGERRIVLTLFYSLPQDHHKCKIKTLKEQIRIYQEEFGFKWEQL